MLIDYFDRGVMLAGDGPCLINGETQQVYSYNEVRKITLRTATGLLSEGFGPGTIGAVLSPNDALAFICTLGIFRSGTIWIPINPRNSAFENGKILNKLDCEVLFYHSSFSSEIREFIKVAPKLRLLICIDRPDGEFASFLSWAKKYPEEEINIPFDPYATAIIQPTGGTTGEPKGVRLAHRSLEYCVSNLTAVAPCSAQPVHLAAAPLTHAAGFFMHYILAHGGKTIVLPSPEPNVVLAAIETWKATHLVVVPTILYAFLACPSVGDHDYSSLEYCFYGGSPAAPDKIREAIDVFGPVLIGIYAQSETCLPVTCLTREDHSVVERLRSCGRPVPLCQVQIIDENDRLVPAGTIGELAVRSSGVMKGYYQDDEASEQAFTSDGWLKTGDVGYVDSDGYCYLVDRQKDMIITGGFNVYSVEVETAILSNPLVENCAVIGVPHEKWGEAIMAIIQMKPGEKITSEQIISDCKARLGGVKAPKRVVFVEELPKSAAGKVLKRDLRERFWEGQSGKI